MLSATALVDYATIKVPATKKSARGLLHHNYSSLSLRRRLQPPAAFLLVGLLATLLGRFGPYYLDDDTSVFRLFFPAILRR